MDTEITKPATPDAETIKIVRRAIVKKIAVNVTVGILVTVASTVIVNLIDRAFASDDDETTDED